MSATPELFPPPRPPRRSHRPLRWVYAFEEWRPCSWGGDLRTLRLLERIRRKTAAHDALEAADPLWWCDIDPLLVHDPLAACQSLFRRNAGLSVATGPGRLP